MKSIFLFFASLIFMQMNSQELKLKGLNYSESNFSFEETYKTIKTTLENNSKIGIIAEIDHSANAQKVGLNLPKTKLILFGNPNLGTPLMKANMISGIDLPQKIVVFEKNTKVIVAYNDADYLTNRHQLNAIPTIPIIAKALETIVSKATGNTVNKATEFSKANEGIISLESENTFNTTVTMLKNTITNNENLKILAELDHQKNAAKIGGKLYKSTLVVFGNPKIGSPLMQVQNAIAIDLPQKILVWEDENSTVHISYNNPDYLLERHGITDKKVLSEKIMNALSTLAKKASAK